MTESAALANTYWWERSTGMAFELSVAGQYLRLVGVGKDGKATGELRRVANMAELVAAFDHMVVGLPRNPLVEHVWRLLPERKVFKNWFLNQGVFVRHHRIIRQYVVSYVETRFAPVAMSNLCTAVEMLLRAALKVEGVTLPPKPKHTLPVLLDACVSDRNRFFNLPQMCCDTRAIWVLNTHRIGAAHGTYDRDQAELRKSGWSPPDPGKAYEDVIDARLLGAHSAFCRIIDQVDPETGRFLKEWEPRGFDQCQTRGHERSGKVPAEPNDGEAEHD